jgi:hypothetical protein
MRANIRRVMNEVQSLAKSCVHLFSGVCVCNVDCLFHFVDVEYYSVFAYSYSESLL